MRLSYVGQVEASIGAGAKLPAARTMKLNERSGSYSSTSSAVKLVIFIFVTVLVTSGVALADSSLASKIAGKKFIINNITPFNGIPPCPPAHPNTVAFYPATNNGVFQNGTVKAVGQFDGAGFGVCNGSFYAIKPNTTIKYEIWGDWVVYRVFDRVGTASKVVPVKNGFAFVSNGQDFSVSILTPAGNAK